MSSRAIEYICPVYIATTNVISFPWKSVIVLPVYQTRWLPGRESQTGLPRPSWSLGSSSGTLFCLSSCALGLNFDYLLEQIWEKLALIRVYTKRRGEMPDFSEPCMLRSGSTVRDVVCCDLPIQHESLYLERI